MTHSKLIHSGRVDKDLNGFPRAKSPRIAIRGLPRPMRRAAVSVAMAALVASLAGCATKGDANTVPLPTPPPEAPPARIEAIDPTLTQVATRELLSDANADDPVLRSNSIEAISKALPDEAMPIILKALNDPEPEVRFAAAMAAGELRIKSLHQPLLILRGDSDARVVVSSLFALHRIGDTRYSHDLEKYARDSDQYVRADVAMAIGLLGEPSGVVVVAAMQTDYAPTVRLQADAAMWQLGDMRGLTALVGDCVSQYPDDQIIGVLGLAAPRDQRVIQHVRTMLTADYLEVQLAAARAMGELGSDEGYQIAALATTSKDPRQRFLAAMALGAIGRSDAQSRLRPLLSDEATSVRIGAALAVLQLKN
jgi:HEAT repeat protein